LLTPCRRIPCCFVEVNSHASSICSLSVPLGRRRRLCGRTGSARDRRRRFPPLGTHTASVLPAAAGWPWPASGEGPIGASRSADRLDRWKVAPGLLGGRAAADGHSVRRCRVLGIVGGAAIAILGIEAMVWDDGFFQAGAAAGMGLVVLAAVPIGTADPDATTMQEIEGRRPAYARAFAEAYSGRLRTRRTWAAIGGGGMGIGAGVLASFGFGGIVCSRGQR
jgi:hypothetical protein